MQAGAASLLIASSPQVAFLRQPNHKFSQKCNPQLLLRARKASGRSRVSLQERARQASCSHSWEEEGRKVRVLLRFKSGDLNQGGKKKKKKEVNKLNKDSVTSSG